MKNLIILLSFLALAWAASVNAQNTQTEDQLFFEDVYQQTFDTVKTKPVVTVKKFDNFSTGGTTFQPIVNPVQSNNSISTTVDLIKIAYDSKNNDDFENRKTIYLLQQQRDYYRYLYYEELWKQQNENTNFRPNGSVLPSGY